MAIEVKVAVITGVSPLLMHNPASMANSAAAPGVGKKKVYTAEEDAEKGLYKTAGGEFYLPSGAFRSAILRQCTGRKIGKASALSLVSGALSMAEEECVVIDGKGKPVKTYRIDSRRVVVQRQGIIRSRPRFDEWRTRVAFEIDMEMITPEIVMDLLTGAGRAVGVGDYRPEKKGTFGKFTAEWEK